MRAGAISLLSDFLLSPCITMAENLDYGLIRGRRGHFWRSSYSHRILHLSLPACSLFTILPCIHSSHILLGFGFSVAVAHRICYLSRESTGAAVSAAGRRAGGRCFLPPCCGPALPPSLGLLSTVGQCPKEFPCSSPARPTDRLRGRDRPCHPFTRSAISGEMHDPLLDDCFSVCLFRGVAIASASGEHASARRRRQFLFETKNSQP